MRFFIEEQLDFRANEIKEYVSKINVFSDKDLLDEIINNLQANYPNSVWAFNIDWINDFKETWKIHTHINLITKAIEEKYYLLDDEEEHSWNVKVIESIINGKSIVNRYTNETY